MKTKTRKSTMKKHAGRKTASVAGNGKKRRS
jgi:hypothetical protein